MTARKKAANTVPSVRATVDVLNYVSTHPGGTRIADLIEVSGLSRATIYRICAALQEANYLERGDGGTFIIGSSLVAAVAGSATQDNLNMRFYHAVGQVEILAEKTTMCGVLDDRYVAYIATRASNLAIGIQYRVGLRLPAHSTATGKALLSNLDQKERESWLSVGPYQALTEHTLTDAESLGRELEESRARGFAIDDEETSIGMYCLALGVKPLAGVPPAAVGVTVLKAQVTDALRADLVVGLRELTRLMYGQM